MEARWRVELVQSRLIKDFKNDGVDKEDIESFQLWISGEIADDKNKQTGFQQGQEQNTILCEHHGPSHLQFRSYRYHIKLFTKVILRLTNS
jgi:hypothetical protein